MNRFAGLAARLRAASSLRRSRHSLSRLTPCEPLESRVLLSGTPPAFANWRADAERADLAIVTDFTDPDAGESHTATVDWGDGSAVETVILDHRGPGGTIYSLHEYAASGSYSATMTLTDAAGNAVSRTANAEIVRADESPAQPWTPFGGANSPVAPAGGDFAAPMGEENGEPEPDATAPAVAEVLVGSTAWTANFRNYLAATAQGTGGFAIPAGPSQVHELPWINLNQVIIRFTEDVAVAQDDLTIHGVNAANYATSAFTYDPLTFTATWTLPASLTVDKLSFELDADALTGVIDLAGNALDGEWIDGSDAFPSGDTTPGGNFRFRAYVLPGDADRDGDVDDTPGDVQLVRDSQGFSPGSAGYSPFYDANGSGTLMGSDVTAVRNRLGHALPWGEPILYATPTALQLVEVSSTTASFEWIDNAATEEWFDVQRSADGGVTWQDAGSADADDAYWSDNALTPSATYQYRVRAANAVGVSQWSVALAVTLAPAAPDDLLAMPTAMHQIQVEWDVVPEAITYNLYRATGTSAIDVDAIPYQSGLTAATFTDTGVAGNTAYRYAVTAVAAAGEGARSASVVTATAAPAVANLQLTRPSPGTFELRWDPTPDDGREVMITVQRSMQSEYAYDGPHEHVATLPAGAGSYVVSGLGDDAVKFTVSTRHPNGLHGIGVAGANWSPTLLPPTNFVAEVIGPWVNLSWTDNSTVEIGYLLEWVGSGVVPPTPKTLYLPVNATQCTFQIEAGSGHFELRAVSEWPTAFSAGQVSAAATAHVTTGPTQRELPSVKVFATWPSLGGHDESSTTAQLRLTRAGGDVSGELVVGMNAPAGTAAEGEDYAALPRTATFPAGITELWLGAVRDDGSVESAFETFAVQVKAGNGYNAHYSFSQPFAEGRILENDWIDVDVDSDNSATLAPGAPDRDEAEDRIEDVPSDDARPGKVLLVNDGDEDGDGVPGYADGFNHDAARRGDERSASGGRLVPITLDLSIGLHYNNNPRVRISYDASDPRAMSASLDEPYVLPAGKVRLWSAGDSFAPSLYNWRNNGTFPHGTGGAYVPPGEYAWGTGVRTLYVEAVRPSATTGDIAITVELDPDGADGPKGYEHADTIRLTATRMEIWARGLDEAEFRQVDWFVNSDLSEPPDLGDGSEEPLTAGAFQTYQVRVYDPRTSGIENVTLAGQEISLLPQGDYYQTPEFVTVKAGAQVGWSVPYQIIELDEASEELSYNPKRKQEVLDLVNPPPHLKFFRRQLDQAVADMVREGWVSPEAGDGKAAFGREVDKRIGTKIQTQINGKGKGWVSDLLVNATTKEIVSIGAGRSQAGHIQVDHVYMKDVDNPFQRNQTFDMDRVETVVDVKASSINRLRGSQRERLLLNLTNNGTVHTVNTRHLYTKANGFYRNPTRGVRVRAFKLLGIAATTGVAIGILQSDWQFDWLVERAVWIAQKDVNGGYNSDVGKMQKKHDVAEWTDTLCEYMANFMPDSDSIDALRAGMTYGVFLGLLEEIDVIP